MSQSRRHFLIGAALGRAGIAKALQPAPPGAAEQQSGETLSVRDFGVMGDGRTDDHGALSAAVTVAAREGKALVLPSGVYLHSRPLNLAFGGLRIRGEGLAILRYTGASSPCVSMDAGGTSIIYDHVLENLIIEGSGAAGQDGLFVRNMPHGLRRNIRVRNVTGRAFHILGDVLSIWESCIVSPNERAFRTVPARAFQIGASDAVSATTAVLFINCMAEGATEYGWYLDRCEACRWIGGTSEGIRGGGHVNEDRAIGLFVGAGASQNSFNSFFMEQNEGGDAIISGNGNRFADCVMQSRATTSPYEAVRSISVSEGARGTRFEGGSAYFAAIERGALNTTFRHMELGHSINDRGTGTVIADCLQMYHSAQRPPSRTFGNVEDDNPLALDWYQEMRFEPSLQGARSVGRLTYGRRAGLGTRIGNVFHFSIELEIASVQASPAGAMMISGLPFPASAGMGGTGVVGEAAHLGTGDEVFVARIAAGEQVLRLLRRQGDVPATAVDGAALRTGAVLYVSGQYHI
jgi:hypothetical protein